MEKLYEEALKAYHNSYSPYSRYKVGASILLSDGKIINGCNVENASYGLTNCAERTALFYAFSQGYRKEDIKKLLVIADGRPASPCGACRQVLVELMNPDAEVILTNLNKEVKILKVKELLPYYFSGEDLNEL
ncbi:MAG TPA: cytidine deaminase [Acholeplasmataceae bacterium]|nr:cytidine deaminase [Acholeplasmataceae bacterium]